MSDERAEADAAPADPFTPEQEARIAQIVAVGLRLYHRRETVRKNRDRAEYDVRTAEGVLASTRRVLERVEADFAAFGRVEAGADV